MIADGGAVGRAGSGSGRTRFRRAAAAARRRVGALGRRAVELGLPPAWTRFRWVPSETIRTHMTRRGWADGGRYEVVHEAARASNPLPVNVERRGDLPAERGWWGFSFRDVPSRRNGATAIATLPECRVACCRDHRRSHAFHPCVLSRDDRALDLREMRFRRPHAEALRRKGAVVELERATWILERVYDNHAHWLTAHLPKVLLLRDRGELAHVVLPRRRTPVMDRSLRMLGLEPDGFPQLGDDSVLAVEELTLLETDRFRPELLRRVRDAYAPPGERRPYRRVFISRAGARWRRLVNEERVWGRLQREGFERVRMESLSFEEQVALMRETAVLVAPHGAGLTNMLFCPPGTHVVEIVDPSWPSPNFYAMAVALGHPYWLLEGGPVPRRWAGTGGTGPAAKEVLARRDMEVDVNRLAKVVGAVDQSRPLNPAGGGRASGAP